MTIKIKKTIAVIVATVAFAGVSAACSIEEVQTTCVVTTNSTVNGVARTELDGAVCTTTRK